MPMPVVPLNPHQVDLLFRDFTARTIESLPEQWDQLFLDFRAMGDFVELDGQVITRLGGAVAWQEQPGAVDFLVDLRANMYERGRGVWFSLKYHLIHPGRFEVRYGWQHEPDWTHRPPPEFFRRELERFPREDEHVPDWLRQAAA